MTASRLFDYGFSVILLPLIAWLVGTGCKTATRESAAACEAADGRAEKALDEIQRSLGANAVAWTGFLEVFGSIDPERIADSPHLLATDRAALKHTLADLTERGFALRRTADAFEATVTRKLKYARVSSESKAIGMKLIAEGCHQMRVMSAEAERAVREGIQLLEGPSGSVEELREAWKRIQSSEADVENAFNSLPGSEELPKQERTTPPQRHDDDGEIRLASSMLKLNPSNHCQTTSEIP